MPPGSWSLPLRKRGPAVLPTAQVRGSCRLLVLFPVRLGDRPSSSTHAACSWLFIFTGSRNRSQTSITFRDEGKAIVLLSLLHLNTGAVLSPVITKHTGPRGVAVVFLSWDCSVCMTDPSARRASCAQFFPVTVTHSSLLNKVTAPSPGWL